jgi:hypothetical protein
MIVESQQGNELATSEDIEPISSGELSFRPNMTGTLQYHCEYHSTTMRGTIEVPLHYPFFLFSSLSCQSNAL